MRPLIWYLSSSIICSVACGLACSPPDSPGRLSQGASPNDPAGAAGTGNNPGSDTMEGGGFLADEPDESPIEVIPEGCGNGDLAEDEVCDDGNTVSGDGCAATCGALEPGFSCAEPGKPCLPLARCGDGIVALSELCDDGNVIPGDGCSDRCRVELGSKCEGQPSTCTPTTCGDGVQEGAEACDDGNTLPFDGCSSLCLSEPNCEGLSCTSECGDGLVINEECDDGNTVSGDGCSANCTIEDGFTCERATACELVNDECVLRVPAIFRDFTSEHPDFGGHTCSTLAQGAVEATLNEAGKPVMSSGMPTGDPCLTTPDNFTEWYAAGQTYVDELVLFDNGRGGYVNRFDKEGTFFTSGWPKFVQDQALRELEFLVW